MTPILLQHHYTTPALEAVHQYLQQHQPQLPNGDDHPDFVILNEIDKDSHLQNITIEQVRSLPELVSQRPFSGKKRVVVLANIDAASLPAQNALLKILEESPEHTLFILPTSQPNTIVATIHSRCRLDTLPLKKQQNEDNQDAAILYDLATNAETGYGAMIDKLSNYKKRPAAIRLLQKTLEHIMEQPRTQQTTQQLAKVQSTIERLHQNATVQLALEDCFFEMRRGL